MDKYVISYIHAYHTQLAQEERVAGRPLYDKFGQWKKEHPEHPLSKAYYPDNEYLFVISAFRDYFNSHPVGIRKEELDI